MERGPVVKCRAAGTLAETLTLAIETATPYLALGLLGPQGRWTLLSEVGRAHAERLPAALTALLEQARLPKNAVERLVIGTGPGSYTGVRVGASYALGLGRALGVPVLGVGTLEALIDAEEEGEQAVSMDARKGQVYGAVYRVSGGQRWPRYSRRASTTRRTSRPRSAPGCGGKTRPPIPWRWPKRASARGPLTGPCSICKAGDLAYLIWPV